MRYWLNLYTWNTWQEFLKAGGEVTGFRERRWTTVKRIKPGDVFLCYMTGLSRYFALQEVTGKPYKDDEQIWSEASFSCRVPVKVVLSLPPEHAVPVALLREHLSFFQNMKTPHSWSGHFRGSPLEEDADDANVIIDSLRDAEASPAHREFDPRKLERKANVYETKSGTVSIPDDSPEDEGEDVDDGIVEPTSHVEIQWLLLHIGDQMGLDLWVARDDQSKSYQGMNFQEFKSLKQSLPMQFDNATNRTIELIDVLWLQGNSIVAAFEIEHTTAIYSGILRMADLITMQPNLKIPLFIVAPDIRRDKVEREINRPVFKYALKQSLPEICQYISYTALKQYVERAGDFLSDMKPSALYKISEDLRIEDL